MELKPTKAQILWLAEKYSTVPLSTTLPATVTPTQVLQKLKTVSRHCYMLESCEDKESSGRYTFLGFDPQAEIHCKDGKGTVMDENGSRTFIGSPKPHIAALLERHKSPRLRELPTFTGGLVGYFAYDYAKYSEPRLELTAAEDGNFNDVDLMLFDKVIAFDHVKEEIILIFNMNTCDPEAGYRRGQKELEIMCRLVTDSPSAPCPPKARLQADFAPQFDQAAYTAMVEKAKGYIREGDIFQVVLSNSLSAKMEGSLFDAYQILRRQNPSPYMFYFSSDDIEIAGASPETLVKLTDGKLFTYPLAGTRPRGKTPAEDAALEAGLLQDKKELSEHNMLVDLGRNDLGRVSAFGSVKVSAYHRILKFSHVMHIGSEVEGQLAPGKTALDAIEAVLPAGTLSGAPKFRAMQIIDELEGSKRGIYGGAIGYIDLTGNMDTCISIRIAYKKNGTVYIRSGAGIVADSVPEKEHTECINKAMAVVQAVRESAGNAQ
jgi:anthranilate synthase component 1